MDGDFCETVCYMEPNCVSYNLKKKANKNGKYKCELNNSTFEGQKDKLKTKSEYIYRGAKVREVLKIKFKSGKQTNRVEE